MALTFTWNQRTGATSATITSDLGISGNLFNFQNQDVASAAQYTAYPITAGNNSYEIFLRGHYTGSFNKVYICALYKSLLINGETLIVKTKTTLTKQINKIIGQVQRLSEETFIKFIKEATVRTFWKQKETSRNGLSIIAYCLI